MYFAELFRVAQDETDPVLAWAARCRMTSIGTACLMLVFGASYLINTVTAGLLGTFAFLLLYLACWAPPYLLFQYGTSHGGVLVRYLIAWIIMMPVSLMATTLVDDSFTRIAGVLVFMALYFWSTRKLNPYPANV